MIDEGLSIREIGRRIKSSYTNVRYWLHHHDLKTRCRPNKSSERLWGERRCSCGETALDKFYGNKLRMCSKCFNAGSIRRNRQKQELIRNHLGGRCIACGFNKYPAALQVHHVDPKGKDPAFRHVRSWSWQRIERELMKCVLLCSNCHVALHAGQIDSGIIELMVAVVQRKNARL